MPQLALLAQSVRNITPPVALDLGYSLYLADAASVNSALRDSARAALARLVELEQAFERDTNEWFFFLQIRSTINSLARGISRRKTLLEERLRAAEQEKTRMIRRFAETQRAEGILRGGFRLFLLGGFGYTLMMSFFKSRMLQGHVVSDQPGFYSLAFALALALVGSFLTGWLSERRLIAISSGYEKALDRANREYTLSARAEYDLAWSSAAQAWKNLTGEEVPELVSFKVVLERMMDLEPSRPANNLAESLSVSAIWKKLTARCWLIIGRRQA